MLAITIEHPLTLEGLDEDIKQALAEKFGQQAQALYDKVIANVSGKVLQTKTGDLRRSIYKEVDLEGDFLFAIVGVNPESPKAWALEVGGKGYYPIDPINVDYLRFIGKGDGTWVFTKHVSHPPSQAYGYLALALEEMEGIFPDEMMTAINQAIQARVYSEYR
jgi:hypothetical protein